MNIFRLRDALIEDYASFVSSYVRIKDPKIKELVEAELSEGALWPDPLVQLNPSFVKGETIDELVTGEGRVEGAGIPLQPFKWDENRRAILRAELDAYYAKLYGLTEEELRYILDPKDVYGDDFPSETFRVLKEKETRLYGEYRTKRLVLEAWRRLRQER